MSIKQNITSLQNLLEQVNSLPEVENLDTEISTQSTLLSEQDAKIAELAEILAGKTCVSPVELCLVQFQISDRKTSSTMRHTTPDMSSCVTTSFYLYSGAPIYIPKNTIVYFEKGTIGVSGNGYQLASNAYIIYGNCTFSIG